MQGEQMPSHPPRALQPYSQQQSLEKREKQLRRAIAKMKPAQKLQEGGGVRAISPIARIEGGARADPIFGSCSFRADEENGALQARKQHRAKARVLADHYCRSDSHPVYDLTLVGIC
jgi:hypothetical protein